MGNHSLTQTRAARLRIRFLQGPTLTDIPHRPISTTIDVRSSAPPPPLDGAAVVVIVTDCDAEPPPPVHVNVNVSVASTATAKVPLVAWLPVHPEPPLPAQLVVFWLLQVRVTVLPVVTDEALEVKVTVGGAEATLSE